MRQYALPQLKMNDAINSSMTHQMEVIMDENILLLLHNLEVSVEKGETV